MSNSMADIAAWQQQASPYDRRVRIDDHPHGSTVIEGIPDEKKSSPVRRTFVLFVLFNLILVFLLWILNTQLKGTNGLLDNLKQEVVDYTFKTSLFDIVMLALVRFIALEVVYAAFYSRKPWVIALTTLTTSVFIVAKCVLYDSTKTSHQPLSYALLIVGFVLAWLETVFLEYRVIPQEKAAQQILDCEERASLLNSSGRPRSLYTPSERYFSPIGSPHDSDDEDSASAFNQTAVPRPVVLSETEVQSMIEKGLQYRNFARQLFEDNEDWRVVSDDGNSGKVSWKKIAEVGKTFKIEGHINADMDCVYQELCVNIESYPVWNSTVSSVKRVQMLNDEMDIVHNIASEALGGVITARDFVLLRSWQRREGSFMLVSKSVSHPAVPDKKQPIRGDCKISVIVVERVPGDEELVSFTFFVNTDLKGWLPQRIIDAASGSVLTDFLHSIKKRILVLQQTQTPRPSVRRDSEEDFQSVIDA